MALGAEGEDRSPTERPSLVPGRGPAHNWRIAFAIAWIALQLTLVATAGRRADGAFGFRMFSESSSITVALYREVDGPEGRSKIHVENGIWGAKSLNGRVHRFSWYDRVWPFWVFDEERNASYGAQTQLLRLQGALEDVATHVPDDTETVRFLLDVTIRRNGREPVVYHLASKERIAQTHEEVR